jgi:hypothetical protein
MMRVKRTGKTLKLELIFTAVLLSSQFSVNAADINWKKLQPKQITPTEEIPYCPDKGEVYVVNSDHTLPKDMIVQGERLRLSISDNLLLTFEKKQLKITWKLLQGMGNPTLKQDSENEAKAIFHADQYGDNIVQVSLSDNNKSEDYQVTLKCQFSTTIMLSHDFPDVKVPKGQVDNPYLSPPLADVVGHRENFMVKNEITGRLHSFWWAKLNHPKRGYLGANWTGLASIVSDDLGLSWHSPRFVVLQDGSRTGWGTGVWLKSKKSKEGEIFIMTATGAGRSNNQILSLRSFDDGEHWTFENDFSDTFKKELEIEKLAGTYFGGNRSIKTAKGTLVSPVVCSGTARAMWSEDNGKSWHSSNMDKSFPKGNEDALIETIDGKKLVFMCRGAGPRNRDRKKFGGLYYRSESKDGGKTWVSKGESKLITAGVNMGMTVINDTRSTMHGFALHTTAAQFHGRHKRHSLVISINDDLKGFADKKWDSRLLLDYRANYSDIVYQKEDQSFLATVETWYWGKKYEGHHAWGDTPIIRTFKFSPQYLKNLPKYQSE